VRDPDGAATYPDITVQFIGGHLPEMIVTTVDGEKERIDLAPFTFDALHKLVQDRGLKQKAVAPTAAMAASSQAESQQLQQPQSQQLPPDMIIDNDVRLLLSREQSIDASPRSSDWLLWLAPLVFISLVVLFVVYTPTSSSSSLMFAYQRLMAKCGRRLHLDTTNAV